MKAHVIIGDKPYNGVDPLASYHIAYVEIPEGYRRVFTGVVCPGDQYLNIRVFKDNGIVTWEEVDTEQENVKLYGAKCFACLIRKGKPFEDPCERCQVFAREFDSRFCECCTLVILKKLRRRRAK